MNRRHWLVLAASGALAACKRAPAPAAATTMRDATDASVDIANRARIVTVGGVVTEIVAALGELPHVVAVDASSTFPEAVTHLPQVGYVRQLAAEGVLSLRPSLVITTTEVGPPATLTQLRGAGVPVFVVEGTPGLDQARQRIRRIATVLDRIPQGDALLRTLDAELARVTTPTGARPKVLFLYARGPGAPQVAGRDTAADAMISLAGGENPMRSRWAGYRPLTAESLVSAAPDVLLVTERGLGAMGGPAAIAALPGVAQTACARPGRIVAMEDLLLLGFGPRTGTAVSSLATRLHAAVTA